DSYAYQTVQIGTQCWFAENLRYLPAVHSNSEFATQGINELPGYGVYGYNGSDVPTAKALTNYINYGVLYNWFAVDQASPCPTGWHVPSDTEFLTLEEYVDPGNYTDWCDPIGEPGDCGGEWANAGGYLKQTGTTYWNSPNLGATNAYGFAVLPTGYRDPGGPFDLLASSSYIWSSSSEPASGLSWYRNLGAEHANIYRYHEGWSIGFSIRCLKD
ncbi:hypothetical protein CVU82_00005, partial [Candidatus Falkowbacteria bacterium HGW-Falkowbacteria-1]